jgi:hypothetical protein
MLPLMILAHNALKLGVTFALAELITPLTNAIVNTYRITHTPDRVSGASAGRLDADLILVRLAR